MKTALLTLIALAISLTSFGQAPEAFKYQAVVRDAGGVILTNQAVGYKLTILQGSTSGTAVYSETFNPTTNGYGLVNLEIGTGTTTDDFTIIDWANGPFFMETAADVSGGTSYTVMGTSQLMSVPYALYAKTSGSSTPGPQGLPGNDGAPGPQGLPGNDGAQGPQGLPGNDGAQGPQGLPGNDGAQGLQGLPGNDGAQGLQGLPGNDGAQGPQGIPGNDGAPGPQGVPGNDGAQGPQGLPGNDGAPGSQGIQGNDGLSAYEIWINEGNTGTEADFLSSLEGAQGIQGIQGIQGVQGVQGVPGNDGAPGINGIDGTIINDGTAFGDMLYWDGNAWVIVDVGQPGQYLQLSGISQPTWTGTGMIVTTTAISSLTHITAESGGVVTDNGGTAVSVRGVCWSTSPNPTTADNITTNGAGTGGFASSLTGLTLNTTYYIRAYATNSIGTSYGNQIQFTTLDLPFPSITYNGLPLYVHPTDLSMFNQANSITQCAALNSLGFTDWYLPNQGELNALYVNKAAIGGFVAASYWSSSTFGATQGWSQSFNTGNQSTSITPITSLNCRCVRVD